MSQTLRDNYSGDVLSSSSGSEHQRENEKINAPIHPSLKLIILRSIITPTSDHKRRLTLTHTCPGCEARVHVSGSVCWSITDLRINNWVIL